MRFLLAVNDPGNASTSPATVNGAVFEVVTAQSLADAAEPPDTVEFGIVLVVHGEGDRSGAAFVEAVKARVAAAQLVAVCTSVGVPGAARSADDLQVLKALERTLLLQSAAHAIERRRAADVLRDTEDGYRRLVMTSGEAIIVHAAGTVVLANAAAAGLLRAGSPADLTGKPISGFVHENDGMHQAAWHTASAGDTHPLRLRMVRVDRDVVDIEGHASPCRYDGQPAIQMRLRDVGEGRSGTASGPRSQYDPLTELPNRSEFRERLVGAMARSRRDDRPVGVVVIDLDRFNAINRRFGTDAGDRTLREVAQRLKNSVRRGDTVARVGGDQFAAILEGLSAPDDAGIFARRVLTSLSLPMVIEGLEISLTASLGIAVASGGTEAVDGVLRESDVAMRHAKERGRNNYQFHSPDLDARTRQDELRSADTARRVRSLTPREREVMALLVAGKPNKVVAHLLGTHTRTIENHRARIMDKMGADSLPDLVRMALSAESAGALHTAA